MEVIANSVVFHFFFFSILFVFNLNLEEKR